MKTLQLMVCCLCLTADAKADARSDAVAARNAASAKEAVATPLQSSTSSRWYTDLSRYYSMQSDPNVSPYAKAYVQIKLSDANSDLTSGNGLYDQASTSFSWGDFYLLLGDNDPPNSTFDYNFAQGYYTSAKNSWTTAITDYNAANTALGLAEDELTDNGY